MKIVNPAAGSVCTGACCDRGIRAESGAETIRKEDGPVIALAGQPNTGKSTLFNAITGSSQHVGNWPGKTVEKKQGAFKAAGCTGQIYDLPGTYSLTANSLEEEIAREFILDARPHAVIVVVDATQLERSLYMAAETILLGLPMVIALNKMDGAEKQGVAVSREKMEALTGVPVVPVTATRGRGITGLLDAAVAAADGARMPGESPVLPDFESAFGPVFQKLREWVVPICPDHLPPDWVCLKLLEKDARVTENILALAPDLAPKIRSLAGEGNLLAGSRARYAWIGRILAGVSGQARCPDTGPGLCRFDRMATHPLWGRLMALAVLALSMAGAYLVALPLMIPGFALFFAAGPIHAFLSGIGPDWLASMVSSGILMGVSLGCMIMGFIGGVFVVLGILENTGYLARLAYVADPLMQRVGLHGKSVLPLVMGVVCNIVGVAGTRTIDSWRQRMMTLAMVPVIPCKALLIVTAFICGVFFGSRAPFVMAVLFIAMALLLFCTSFAMKTWVTPGERTGLIMELPPYQRPDWKSVGIYALTRMKGFYDKGFWFLVIFGFISWLGIYFPDQSLDTSYLARVGKMLEPAGSVMGMDWRLCISFLVAFASKEATLGAMAIIFGATASANTDIASIVMDQALWETVYGNFGQILASTGVSTPSALGFVFAVFFSLPCFGTLGMVWAETRSVKWTAGILTYYFFLSVSMGTLAYQTARLMF